LSGKGQCSGERDRNLERAIGPPDSAARARFGSGQGENEILRAKYLDWCSAKVAERFLRLTPDEIYELAQRASRHDVHPSEADGPAAAFPEVESSEPEFTASFRGIVEQVTEVLRAELALPSFEEWAAAYRAEPERYDEELLGLWRERLE